MEGRSGKVWHKFADEKPKNGGYYACLVRYGDCGISIQTIRFYKNSEKFNRGLLDREDLEIVPVYWAKVEELMSVIGCDLLNERKDWIVL